MRGSTTTFEVHTLNAIGAVRATDFTVHLYKKQHPTRSDGAQLEAPVGTSASHSMVFDDTATSSSATLSMDDRAAIW